MTDDTRHCPRCGKNKLMEEFSGRKVCDPCRDREYATRRRRIHDAPCEPGTRRCTGCTAVTPETRFTAGNKTCNECRRKRSLRPRRPLADFPDCPPGTRRCPNCQAAKPESEFSGRKTCDFCRDAHNAANRLRQKNPEYKVRNNKLQRDYNRRIGRVAASWGDTLTATCSRCSTEFSYSLGRRRRTVCDLCRQYHEEWRTHGLTGAEAARIRTQQHCGICGSTDAGVKDRAFRIDHCHKTGKFRDVLCHPCNAGLGMFRDDPNRLRAAATYIESHVPTRRKPGPSTS